MDNLDSHFMLVAFSILLLSFAIYVFSLALRPLKKDMEKQKQLFNVSIIVDDKHHDDIFDIAFRYFRMPIANKHCGFRAYRMEKQPFSYVHTLSKMLKDSNVDFRIEIEHTKKAISYCFVILNSTKSFKAS